MANIKYIIKDPSFKYFIIGLVLFIVITGGGIMAIKNLVNNKGEQKENLAMVEEQRKPDNTVTIDDSKPAPSPNTTPTQPNKTPDVTASTSPETTAPNTTQNVTNPTELSRTGGNGLVTVLGLSALTYVVVLVLQKR